MTKGLQKKKGTFLKRVVIPALYGLETAALSNRQEADLEIAELKIFFR